MPAAVSPLFRKIYKLIISPLRLDHQQSSSSEINEFKTKVANLILRLIDASQKREMPDYIQFVLNSPGLKLMPYPKFLLEPLKQSGKYISSTNQLGFYFPETTSDEDDLVNHVLPQLFWHAFQAILHANRHDPRDPDAKDTPDEGLIRSLPFTDTTECKELDDALLTGSNRITKDYKRLMDLDTDQLTPEEAKRLEKYNQAAQDYKPRRHEIALPIKDIDPQEMITMAYNGQGPLFVNNTNFPFYPEFHEIRANCVTFLGYLSKPGQHQGRALIQDILCEQDSFNLQYMDRDDAPQNTDLHFLSVMDAFIATNSKRLNTVFYPERMAYHRKSNAFYRYATEKLCLYDAQSSSKVWENIEPLPSGLLKERSDGKISYPLFGFYFHPQVEWKDVEKEFSNLSDNPLKMSI